jgi:hypothetical protein
MWMNPNLKVYTTEIYLENNDSTLRTGMSCLAEIVIEQHQNVLYIPIQAVMRVGGEPTVYVRNGKKFEPRKVQTGLDNNSMIHIIKGLEEYEFVLLTPPLKAAATESRTTSLITQNARPNEDSNDIDSKADEKLKDASQRSAGKIEADVNDNATNSGSMSKERFQQGSPEQTEGKRSRFENMTPEEREKMRKRSENMSPEEREKMKQRFREAQSGN